MTDVRDVVHDISFSPLDDKNFLLPMKVGQFMFDTCIRYRTFVSVIYTKYCQLHIAMLVMSSTLFFEKKWVDLSLEMFSCSRNREECKNVLNVFVFVCVFVLFRFLLRSEKCKPADDK